MLIYYDLIADKEIASDSFPFSVPCPGIKAIESKRIVVTEDDVDIGANASADGGGEEDEGVDASEAQNVINVVYAAKLQSISLDKKEFKTMIKAYFQKLVATYGRLKYDLLGFDDDYVAPKDKAEAKQQIDDALKSIKATDKKKIEDLDAGLARFKANFESVQKFVTDEILANFDECEFYTVEEGELGNCMIIPARFVGEATAPIFYLFQDGLREKKE